MQLDLDVTGAPVGTPQRFSGVQYCRLHMGKGAGITPEVTELAIGARYQLQRWPNNGFNPDNIADLTQTSEPTKGGGIDKTISARNQFRQDAEWTMKQSETADLKTWWKKGQCSYLWVWQPSSAPAAFNLMVRDDDYLELPWEGRYKRTFRLVGTEQGPESKYLENE